MPSPSSTTAWRLPPHPPLCQGRYGAGGTAMCGWAGQPLLSGRPVCSHCSTSGGWDRSVRWVFLSRPTQQSWIQQHHSQWRGQRQNVLTKWVMQQRQPCTGNIDFSFFNVLPVLIDDVVDDLCLQEKNALKHAQDFSRAPPHLSLVIKEATWSFCTPVSRL